MSQELDPTAHELPSLTVSDSELSKAAFVIPMDAPLPNELSDLAVPTGSLLTRIAALESIIDVEGEEDKFRFIPISGAEFLALERAWRSLQTRKHVYVLTELPGARYDVLFDQARRVVGIRALDWPAVSAALESHHRLIQRTTDASPWKLAAPCSKIRQLPKGNDGPMETLPAPTPDEEP